MLSLRKISKKMVMKNIITDKLPQIALLCDKYCVASMYLFGSAATDFFNETSDIDFLISFRNDVALEEYADNYFDLMFELETLFDRNVDLVTEKTLANPYFIRSVEQSKQLIYAT